MQEDNVYVNDGAFYAMTDEVDVTDVERDKEENEVRTSAPTLAKAIDHLQQRAGFYESINAIDQSVLLNPEEFMHVVAGNKHAATILRQEAQELKGLLDEYTQTK